jgi:hypothetical protein
MINIEKSQETDPKPPVPQEPDEHSGMIVQGFFKISDPESGEIIIQGRD